MYNGQPLLMGFYKCAVQVCESVLPYGTGSVSLCICLMMWTRALDGRGHVSAGQLNTKHCLKHLGINDTMRLSASPCIVTGW